MKVLRVAPAVMAMALAQTPLVAQEPEETQARHPMPAGNPGTWITDNDYPAWAMRSDIEGVVSFTLAIDGQGQVTGCEIRTSSETPALDDLTCQLLTQRARFIPALGDAGEPVAGTYTSSVRWQIPGSQQIPVPTSQSMVMVVVVETDGSISSCEVTGSDQSAMGANPCANVPEFLPPVDENDDPRRVRMVVTNSITVEELSLEP